MQEIEEKVKLIKQRIQMAQCRQKSYVYNRRYNWSSLLVAMYSKGLTEERCH